MDRQKKIKVLIALSGGVDSSVAAALLVRAGFDVTGAYMKQWSDTKDVHGVCQWKSDRRDALRVAAHIGIPLLTLDFEKEYRRRVADYMFAEYKKGRTPNPDVLCNTYIKFGVWLAHARKLGFDTLATGHYARITSAPKHRSTEARFCLMQAKDKNKDQTYFLHQLNQEQLSRTMFPIGNYTKPDVRRMARQRKLPTAKKEESMGICFVGVVPMKEFLAQKIKSKNGEMVMSDGTILGEHDGLPFYTIGQRHLKISNAQTRPLYVVDKDFKKNLLIVGYEDDPLLYKKEIQVSDTRFVSGQAPKFPLQCEVRLRHRQPLQKSKIKNQKSKVIVEFEAPQKAVTPGQFAVFYKNGECLGGGVIC